MSGSLNPPLFPPSGIVRDYGVNFFIYVLPGYPAQMAATNSPNAPSVPWTFLVSPSAGLMNYFDYLLGAAPFVQNGLDDCLNEAFCADNGSSGGAMMLPG